MSTILEQPPGKLPELHLVPDDAPNVQQPYLADEVGHLSLGFLLIDATRYNLGRPGEPARQFAFALARTLPQIVPHVRQQLVQDVGHALHKDAARQAMRAGSIFPMPPATFTPADRQAWQGLLQVAAVLGTAPDEFRHTAGS